MQGLAKNNSRYYDSLCPYPITSSTLYFNCDVVVGGDEKGLPDEEKIKMQVWPNPGHGQIHVKLPDWIALLIKTEHLSVTTTFHQWKKELDFEVFDLFGKRIFSRTVNPEEDRFDLDASAWSNGLYLFRLSYHGTRVDGKTITIN